MAESELGDRSGATDLLVVAAMKEEVAPLIAALSELRWLRTHRRRWVEGRLNRRTVAVMWCGVGRRRAKAAARELPQLASDREVLIVGIAGALSPSLSRGAVVVARSIHCHRQAPPRPLRPSARCPLDEQVQPADLLTIDEIVATPAHRDVLWRDLGCPEVAAADMESYHLAEAAQQSSRAWSVLRVISDDHEELLPDYLPACYDPARGLRRGKIAAWAIRRPASLRQLLALRRRVRRAALTLARAVIDWSRRSPFAETALGCKR